MRGLVLASLVCWLGVAAPAAALAQSDATAVLDASTRRRAGRASGACGAGAEAKPTLRAACSSRRGVNSISAVA